MIFHTKWVAALIALWSIGTVGASAMALEDFGRMNTDDEATYVAFLVEASAQTLKAQGHPEKADQTIAFFKETGKTGGTQRLAENMKNDYDRNHQAAINPNNRKPVYQVEDALVATLQERNIVVPVKYLLTRSLEFHPVGPPRMHIGGP